MDEVERIFAGMEASIKEAMARCEEAVMERAAKDAYTITEDIKEPKAQKLYYETVLWCIRRGARLVVEELYNMMGIGSHEPQETDDRD